MREHNHRFVFIAMMFFLQIFFWGTVSASQSVNSEKAEIQKFAQYMVDKHKFEKKQINKWLSHAQYQQSIINAISKPAEALPWFKYKKIFITNKRIESGVAFWQSHEKVLNQAAAQYGVPPEIIVAILGVETFYGKHAGNYRVIDALYTLAFYYPPRAKFFKKELEEFLLLAREEKWDPAQIMGSYAGAMGKPQFIASSYRQYAVDFNRTGARDLLQSTEDAIGSVANYFKVHGWQQDKPIALPATVKGQQYKNLSVNRRAPKPSYTLAQVSQAGIHTGQNSRSALSDEKFALIALEGEIAPEYWLGLENFYVITRYNHSDLYAMAVFELSQKIKSTYNKEKGIASRTTQTQG